MVITQDGIARLRKSADTQTMLLDYSEITLVLERNRTRMLFKQDGIVVATRDLPRMENGDTLNIDGKFRGWIEVRIDQLSE